MINRFKLRILFINQGSRQNAKEALDRIQQEHDVKIHIPIPRKSSEQEADAKEDNHL